MERSVLREDLAAVAFSLKAGERSGVIEKPDGCYLMLVEDVKAAHVKTLAEVREEVERADAQSREIQPAEKQMDRSAPDEVVHSDLLTR